MKKFCQSHYLIIRYKACSLFNTKYCKITEFISGKLQLLAEISGEQRELLEKYMDIVDHAHFQEEQRAYYQGMIDAIQIFEGLGILKKRNKVK